MDIYVPERKDGGHLRVAGSSGLRGGEGVESERGLGGRL